LSWLIIEELSDPRSRTSRMSLAVVPDDKDGWRIIVANQSRRFLTAAADEKRLEHIQRKLRLVYQVVV
jgi:hypothetical protein